MKDTEIEVKEEYTDDGTYYYVVTFNGKEFPNVMVDGDYIDVYTNGSLGRDDAAVLVRLIEFVLKNIPISHTHPRSA